MLSSSLYTMLKLSKTTSPNKLFDYDCVTLYITKKNLFLVDSPLRYLGPPPPRLSGQKNGYKFRRKPPRPLSVLTTKIFCGFPSLIRIWVIVQKLKTYWKVSVPIWLHYSVNLLTLSGLRGGGWKFGPFFFERLSKSIWVSDL